VTRWAVILAGGVGSRFWPVSTPSRPKQLLPLATREPMLADALARLAPLVPAERTLVLTNAGLVDAITAIAPALPRENVIAEPRPAGTAAALAWAAHEIERRAGSDAVMLSVHADWAIGDAEEFRSALNRAAVAAEKHEALVTVGVVPVRPDPGFGYIQPGDTLSHGVRRVARFVEKPSRERAEVMVGEGYLWNSGIFVWRVGDFLDELRAHTPEVAPQLAAYGDDLAGFFAAVTDGIAVDVGVLERSSRVLVLSGDSSNAAAACSCCPVTSAGTTSVRGRRSSECGSATTKATPYPGSSMRSIRATTWCTPTGTLSSSTVYAVSSSSRATA
jgi:mannose-1-phosphate guanylyltransferase